MNKNNRLNSTIKYYKIEILLSFSLIVFAYLSITVSHNFAEVVTTLHQVYDQTLHLFLSLPMNALLRVAIFLLLVLTGTICGTVVYIYGAVISFIFPTRYRPGLEYHPRMWENINLFDLDLSDIYKLYSRWVYEVHRTIINIVLGKEAARIYWIKYYDFIRENEANPPSTTAEAFQRLEVFLTEIYKYMSAVLLPEQITPEIPPTPVRGHLWDDPNIIGEAHKDITLWREGEAWRRFLLL